MGSVPIFLWEVVVTEVDLQGEVCGLDGSVYAVGECLCIKLTKQQLASSENS